MKKTLTASLFTLFVMVSLTGLSYAGTITASIAPVTDSANKDQPLSVSIKIDVSKMDESLGSYTATLKWDSQVLKYINYQPGSASGFTQLVNERQAEKGLLTFGAVNPYGAEGVIHVLNVVFQVIGSEGSQCDLQLIFTDMMSAKTFHDLLPYMQSVQTGVEHGITVGEQPKEYSVEQNYPNPFNPSTRINYALPQASHVTLLIFNTLGQKVKTLVDEQKGAGNYAIEWDGRDDAGKEVPIGAYLYKLKAGSYSETKQMLFVK